jgi:hypothetical protein
MFSRQELQQYELYSQLRLADKTFKAVVLCREQRLFYLEKTKYNMKKQ